MANLSIVKQKSIINSLRIGEYLVNQGFITSEKLDMAIETQKRQKGSFIGDILIGLGFIKEISLYEILAKQYNYEFLHPDEIRLQIVDLEDLKKLGDNAKVKKIVPINYSPDGNAVVVSDPTDFVAIDLCTKILGNRKIYVSTKRAVEIVLEIATTDKEMINELVLNVVRDISSGEARELGDYILRRAILDGATDIHIEPAKDTTQVRFRIDGVLRLAFSFPIDKHPYILNVLGGMAGINPGDFMSPREKRISYDYKGHRYDLRYSSGPVRSHGEIVIRILDSQKHLTSLNQLGYSKENIKTIENLMSSPYGIIIVCGPTGSGKTTTLYSILTKLNDTKKKIKTIEDPVEIIVPTISQTDMNPAKGITFASAVKMFLRQDPDVILIGEIRDGEVAKEAFRASMTGHLVLSTLHTNTAIESIPRLLDVGIERYAISSALLGILAQRLARKLCPHCKKQIPLKTAVENSNVFKGHIGIFSRMDIDADYPVYDSQGCNMCYDGYYGRTVISEVFVCTEKEKILIEEGGSLTELDNYYETSNTNNMAMDAIRKVKDGITSISEIERVVSFSSVIRKFVCAAS